MKEFGSLFVIFGVIFIIIGLALTFGPRIPLIGKLPGDIYIRRGNFNFYFPLTTCIIISILLTLILSIFIRR
jgi:uncharacterized protein HemY